MEKTLVVTGKGSVAVSPDRVSIRFPVYCEHRDYSEAVNGLNELVNQLRTEVVRCGIDEKELKTTDFRVETLTRWDKNKEVSVFVGFKALHDLQLEFDLDGQLINQLIRGFIELDENINFRISFTVKDKETCVNNALKSAIDTAKKKAILITKASGVQLKEIIQINHTTTNIYLHSETEMAFDSSTAELREASMPDLNPTDINVSEIVTITWSIV